MITEEIKEYIYRSVFMLATVKDEQSSVLPKEFFTYYDNDKIIIVI